MSPGSINSPAYYNPSDYFKTPYSPVYEVNEDNYGIVGHNVFGRDEGGTPYSRNTGNYSPTESMHSKSPYVQANIGTYPMSSGSYSPQSPSIQDKYSVRGYNATTSGIYPPGSGNPHYSPTTPMNPDYISNYSVRTSNYSGSISPKIQESLSSAHSSQNYSPRSPTYNPKSPSYNLIQSSNN